MSAHSGSESRRAAIRRGRQFAGVALGVVTAVGVTGGTYATADPTHHVTPQSAPTKTPTTESRVDVSVGALKVDHRRPTTQTVQLGIWKGADGKKIAKLKLPKGAKKDTYQGEFLSFNGGLFAATRYPHVPTPYPQLHQRVDLYSRTGHRTATSIKTRAFGANVVHGPNGSILWADHTSTNKTLRIGRLNTDGTRRIYSIPLKNAQGAYFVAGAHSIYVGTWFDHVVAYDITGRKLTHRAVIKASGVQAGFPKTDEVSLWTDKGCGDAYVGTKIVHATSRKTKFLACSTYIENQSPDGRFYSGETDTREVDGGGVGIVLNASGDARLELDYAIGLEFGPHGTLNVLSAGKPGTQSQALAVCKIKKAAKHGCYRAARPIPAITDNGVPTPYALVS